MYSAEEAYNKVVWLFERLLSQRGDAKWIERDLGRCADLLMSLPVEIDDSYTYYKELVHYYTEHTNKKLDKKLLNQRRRHEYKDNFDAKHWAEALEYFGFKCAYCLEDGEMTIDHFVAFSKGGELVKGNVIPVCGSCNSSKNNKDFKEWYKASIFYSKEQEQKVLAFINN